MEKYSMNTFYQNYFSQSIRIYNRNKYSAFYISSSFWHSSILETATKIQKSYQINNRKKISSFAENSIRTGKPANNIVNHPYPPCTHVYCIHYTIPNLLAPSNNRQTTAVTTAATTLQPTNTQKKKKTIPNNFNSITILNTNNLCVSSRALRTIKSTDI